MSNYDDSPLGIRQRMLRLGEVFRPSAPVDDAELFAGRNHELFSVIEAIQSAGQHAVIYGERGVGKTSLARIAIQLASEDTDLVAVRINCDGQDTFSSFWDKALDELNIYASEAPDDRRAVLEPAIAEYAEEREMPKGPRDVVDEDVETAKEHARTDDGVGQVQGAERAFELVLAAVVTEIVGLVGVENADVNNARDTGAAGGLKERLGVSHGLLKGKSRVIEADPVGVVEDAHAAEGVFEGSRVVKGERANVERGAEGVWAAWGVGECANAQAAGKELLGDGAACVSEGARDGVDGGVHQDLLGRRVGRPFVVFNYF
mgnify:CR=1 FL=1